MNDIKREETLRRLLMEAVEPIQPAPDAQARLARRIRIGSAPRKRFWERAGFGWAATGLATASIIVLAVLFVHVRSGDSSKSSSAASGSSATSNPAAPLQSAAAGASPERAPGQHSPAVLQDLDGDGRADSLTVVGDMLVGELSQDGHQSVTLPATRPGARILGITQLASYTGGRIPVVLVRLQERTGFAQDTVAAVVQGRLTVLRIGSGPVLLPIDATHGYACNQSELVVSGNPAAYVIQGDQLVASPQLRAVTAPVGRVTGC